MSAKSACNPRKRHARDDVQNSNKRKRETSPVRENLTVAANPRKRPIQDDTTQVKKKRKNKSISPDELIVSEKSQFSLPVINFDFLIDKSDTPVSRHGKHWKNISIRASQAAVGRQTPYLH